MEYIKIGDLTTVVTGGTPSTSVPEYWDDGNIPWLQSGCCQNCDVIDTEKYITQSGYDNSSTKMMPPDTVMIALTGATAGKVGYLKFDACGNQSITGILPCESVDQRYLFYYLMSQRSKILSDCIGGAQPHISQGYVKDFVVPVLPISEQRDISRKLCMIDELIETRNQQILKLDELVKSRFVELFGDLVFGDKIKTNRHKIGEIASVTKLAGFEFTKYIQYKEQGEIIMLRGLNCKKGKLVLDDVKWIDKDTSDLLPRSKLFYGDILMTYAGTIGDVAMVDADNKYHLAPNVAKITLNDKDAYNPVFLMHLFMYSNDYIMTFASQVAQASINMEKIRSFEYYFPCIDMQNEFATFVKQTDKSKFEIQKSLEKLETLKKALMQKYFG